MNGTVWEQWDGSAWGGVGVPIASENFTDYDLDDGVYQYRYFIDPTYLYSNCVPVGSDPVGWTFGNYVVPDGQFGEPLTHDDLSGTYLWGVDLVATNGRVWEATQTQEMVKWAVHQLEKELNIDIYPRDNYCDDEQNEAIETEQYVRKEFPYPNRRRGNFNIRMNHRPLRDVTRFEFWSPQDTKVIDLMPWMRIDRRNGQLNFRPKQGNNRTFTSYGWPWNLLLNTFGYRDAFHIDYTSGYRDASLIPEDLRDIIGMVAALKMLNAVGDGLMAGFSSSSISLDGLSESFSSTQSATSVGGGMYIRFKNHDVKARRVYRNRNRHIGRMVLSVNKDTNVLEYRECLDVYRHNVSKKKCYRVFMVGLNGETRHVDVTEDHSLYDPTMKKIKGSEVRAGVWLRTMNSKEPKMRVVRVKRLYFRRFMYDLSVDKNENFTANGAIVSNSAFFGARIKVYSDAVKNYILDNKNKYGNFRIGSI